MLPSLLDFLKQNYLYCVAPGDTCVKLCAVGDTGLKTGWVRCKHGVGRGGAGRGGVGWGGVVTYFADRIVPQYKSRSYSPEIFSVCLCVDFFTAVLSIILHREVSDSYCEHRR